MKFVNMFIGYVRISKSDGSQNLDLQIDALIKSGVQKDRIYSDQVSGKKDDRPGLQSCLKSLRSGDTLVVWKLDRLGRNLKHLINTIYELEEKEIAFKVLAGQGTNIDTATPNGKLIFAIFSALAEFERDLISERTKAGLEAARARGRKGGAKFILTKAQVRLAQAAMGQKETIVSELCKELGITKPTLYRYVAPNGELRDHGKRLLEIK